MSEQNGLVRISYKRGLNEKDAAGFKEYRITFDMLGIVVRTEGQYSATLFKDEYRDAQNAMQGAELIILDYDVGVTLGDAVEAFSSFIGIIATTRNHQKEKHGVICDRFRVILPTRKPVMLEVQEFKKMMGDVINHYGTDKACQNISRMYYGYPEAEVFTLDGCQLFDWESFYQTALDKEQQRQQQRERHKRQAAGDHDGAELDKYVSNFMHKNFREGARNDVLFRVARWLRDEQVDDVAGRVAALNSRSGCPLPEDEVIKIIKRQ